MIPQIQADPVARHEQAARRARDDQDRARIEGRFGSVLAAIARERRHLKELGAKRLWLSGAIPAGLPAAWAASGPSGYLQAALG